MSMATLIFAGLGLIATCYFGYHQHLKKGKIEIVNSTLLQFHPFENCAFRYLFTLHNTGAKERTIIDLRGRIRIKDKNWEYERTQLLEHESKGDCDYYKNSQKTVRVKPRSHEEVPYQLQVKGLSKNDILSFADEEGNINTVFIIEAKLDNKNSNWELIGQLQETLDKEVIRKSR